jgi:hypothetical protein
VSQQPELHHRMELSYVLFDLGIDWQTKPQTVSVRSHQYIPSCVLLAGIAPHGRSDAHTPGAESAASHMSERAAAIEAAALEVAMQLAEKQRELNRRRREAALAAKAALVEQMKASIAEIDTEIQVCFIASL